MERTASEQNTARPIGWDFAMAARHSAMALQPSL
jgi:hypothetical protein